MENTEIDRPERAREGPSSLRLADLSMLVVGFALVFSLPGIFHLGDAITISNVPMPGWITWLFVIREATMKVGLILAPVILARCARYRCLPRAVNWLVILIALPLLYDLIQRSDWIRRFARWYLVDLKPSLGYPAPSLLYVRFPRRGIAFGEVIVYGYEGFPDDFTPGEEGLI
jgi:hypothetical protein